MDVGKSISYIFEDDEWVNKVGIGALIAMVPILNFAGIGYEVQVIRSVARGEARPLPRWSNLGQFFMDGLWLALARLVYALPIFVLMGVPFVSWLILVFATATTQDEDRFAAFFPFVFLLCGCAFLIMLLYSLTIGVISPAITAQYIRRGGFGACFDVPAILRFIRDNASNYLTVWLMSLAVGLAASAVIAPVGAFLNLIPCLGQLAYVLLLGAVVVIMYAVTGHLVGQLLREDAARTTGTAALLPPPTA